MGPVGGSSGELAGTASLAEQLWGHLEALSGQMGMNGLLPTNQEMVGEVKAVVDLVVRRLPEFLGNYGACQGLLKSVCQQRFRGPENKFVENYPKIDQDLCFLFCIVELYRQALERMGDILELWGRENLGSLDALAGFLGTGIQALRVGCELRTYQEGIAWSRPILLLWIQNDDATESDGRGPEEAKQAICAKYELTKGATGLFEKMMTELESILGGLGDTRRAEPYRRLQEHVTWCFSSMVKPSDNIKKHEGGLATSGQTVPSESHDLMNVEIFKSYWNSSASFRTWITGMNIMACCSLDTFWVKFLMAPL